MRSTTKITTALRSDGRLMVTTLVLTGLLSLTSGNVVPVIAAMIICAANVGAVVMAHHERDSHQNAPAHRHG